MAPDSFGGTLTAVEAAEAIADGLDARWRRTTSSSCCRCPTAAPASWTCCPRCWTGRPCRCRPPTRWAGRSVGAVLVAGDTAYVESAQATGLHLLTAAERDPLVTSTSGLGALLAAAVECGARTVVVGLGGSATNDAGDGHADRARHHPAGRRRRRAPARRAGAGRRWPGSTGAAAAARRGDRRGHRRGQPAVRAARRDRGVRPAEGAAAGGPRPARRGAGPLGRGGRAGHAGRAGGAGRPARARARPAGSAPRCSRSAAPGGPAAR